MFGLERQCPGNACESSNHFKVIVCIRAAFDSAWSSAICGSMVSPNTPPLACGSSAGRCENPASEKIPRSGSAGNSTSVFRYVREIFSVAGFHSAPALEPQEDAEYWVTPIDPQMAERPAESKLRRIQQFHLEWLTIHEALPGHYVQAEHA